MEYSLQAVGNALNLFKKGIPMHAGFKLGLLVNFGHHPQVEYERIVLDPATIE